MSEIGLLEVRLDPGLVRGDDREQRHLRLHLLAGLQLHVDGNPVHGSQDARFGQIEPGPVAQRLLLAHEGMIVDGHVGGAADAGQHALELLSRHGDAVAGGGGAVLDLLELARRDHAAAREFAVARGLLCEIGGASPCFGKLRACFLVTGLQRGDLLAEGVELGFRALQSQLVGNGIDLDEQVALGDAGVVANGHLDDAPRDLGGHLHDVGLDVGVLGRHVASAREPQEDADSANEQGHADEQDETQRAARQWPHDSSSANESLSLALAASVPASPPS